MAVIKVILVRPENDGQALVPVSNRHLELSLDVNSETALEGVRSYFRGRWSANVHALRWLFPDDFVLVAQGCQDPFLVVQLDDPGRFPYQEVHTESCLGYSEEDANMPFVEAAGALCDAEPWSLPAWLLNTSKWIRHHLPGTRSISQIRVCPNGAVLKIECVEGDYYLKTQLAPLAYESGLLHVLNLMIPGVCPVVMPISLDASSHLTEALHGNPVNPNHWGTALRDVARIQIESCRFISSLDRVGMPHHQLQNLATETEEILNSLLVIQAGSPNELTAVELKQISSLLRKSAADFEALCRCDLPETLVHGDLNHSNVFQTVSGATALIDWALSRVTHPFFILASALFAPYERRQRGDLYRDLWNTYLEPWRDFRSRDRLEAAVDAASRAFWIDSAMAMSLLCKDGHVRNSINLPRFLRAALRAYDLN